MGAVAGDVDNDGRPTWSSLRDAGVRPRCTTEDGRFTDATGAAGLALAGPARAAALVDVDHDGDLDLVAGRRRGADRLFQNTARPCSRTSTRGGGPRPDRAR